MQEYVLVQKWSLVALLSELQFGFFALLALWKPRSLPLHISGPIQTILSNAKEMMHFAIH